MKNRALLNLAAILFAGSALCFAKDTGAWLHKVPAAARAQVNPYAGNPQAIAAGKILFHQHCARCHGDNAQGLHGHPNLHSARLRHATDGQILWIIRNGQLFQGMPTWGALPRQQRWQLEAFIRSLNPPAATQTSGTTQTSGAAQ